MLIKATFYSTGRSNGFAIPVLYRRSLFIGLPFTLISSKTLNSSLCDDIVLVYTFYPRGVYFWPILPTEK